MLTLASEPYNEFKTDNKIDSFSPITSFKKTQLNESVKIEIKLESITINRWMKPIKENKNRGMKTISLRKSKHKLYWAKRNEKKEDNMI